MLRKLKFRQIDVRERAHFGRMRARSAGLAALLAGFAAGLAPGALEAQPPRFPQMGLEPDRSAQKLRTTDEIVVRFHDYAGSAAAQAATARRHGVRPGRALRFARAPIVTMRISAGETPEAAAARIGRDPNVAFAEPNYIFHGTATTPNDTDFGSLWGLKNTTTAANDMDMENAWDMSTDCSSVTVAVVDSGINYNHEDLSANMWDGASCVDKDGASVGGGCPNHGWDFVSSDNDPIDEHGHGTHVAGTIGAQGNNSTGVTGVCWNATLMAVRVLDENNSGSLADIVDGVYFAARNGAKVINLSLGSSGNSILMRNALDYARSNDVVVVAAAGNSDDDLQYSFNESYPCEHTQDNLLCVAALKDTYELDSDYSNYDASSTAADRSVDLAAPGTGVRSAWYAEAQTIDDDFSGWSSYFTGGSAFGVSTCITGDTLVVPNDCSTIPTASAGTAVALNTNSGYYGSVSLPSGATQVTAQYRSAFWGELSGSTCYDAFFGFYDDASGNPAFTGTQLFGTCRRDDSGGIAWNLSECVGDSTCTFGFYHQSDSSGTFAGGAFYDFSWAYLRPSNSFYRSISGTSMATPHVAGLAALLRAYNPSFSAADTINAIVQGGKSSADIANLSTLNGKTRYEVAADGYGAMRYIEPVSITSTTLE